MYNVSENYINVAKSNIRPVIKPTITVSGRDEDGNYVSLVWNAKDIVDFTFKKGIDPLGRTLPYMEFVWKERFSGKFVEEYYPEKYKNSSRYMTVEVSFEQNLNFFNYWKDIALSGKTWSDIKAEFKSWKALKNSAVSEKIKLPKMFLTAKPTISGQEITWVARDLFYFLNTVQSKSFEKNIPFENPIRWFLLDERSNFRNSSDIISLLQETENKIRDLGEEPLTDTIVFDGATKNLLLNYASTRNYYWDFSVDGIELKKAEELLSKSNVVFQFPRKILRENPIINKNSVVSSYSFKRYVVDIDEDSKYDLTPNDTELVGDIYCNHFVFRGLGLPSATQGFILPTISKDTYSDASAITVSPVSVNGVDLFIDNGVSGEVFAEDNKLNTYSKESAFIKKRAELIKKYFNSDISSAEINTLSNVAIETGDLVSFPTNDYTVKYEVKDPTAIPPIILPVFENIYKTGVVVDIELSYNGALKQKTRIHEVKNNV